MMNDSREEKLGEVEAEASSRSLGFEGKRENARTGAKKGGFLKYYFLLPACVSETPLRECHEAHSGGLPRHPVPTF